MVEERRDSTMTVDGQKQDGAARVLLQATMIVLAASLVATIAWAVVTVAARPLDGVEGDVLFEADRIRAGLALYIDPTLGAREYGPPPSRYLVLYPPLWSAVLSLMPRGMAAISGRLLASAAWFGGIAFLAWRAPKERRRVVGIAAAFVAGIWVLALYGANARPDAVAILASGLALERAARRSAGSAQARADVVGPTNGVLSSAGRRVDVVGPTNDVLSSAGRRVDVVGPKHDVLSSARRRVDVMVHPTIDVLSGVLFALAVWTKPNVLGAATGAFLGCLIAARRRVRVILPGLLGVAFTSVVAAGTLHVVSGGAWLEHLLASTGQPPNGTLWLGQIADRGPFFLLPLLGTLVVGVRARRDPGAAIATGALAASTAWALVSLAKIGSASNYFMEPCIAMLVVLSRADVPDVGPRWRPVAAALGLVQASWVGVSSLMGATAAIPAAFARAHSLADVRRTCGATPDGVVLADEPGLELALNGRVIATPFQTTHLIRRGRFPAGEWVNDVASPRVECLVMQDDLLERGPNEDRIARDRFGPELRRALKARFELAAKRGGYWIYRARSRDGASSQSAPPKAP